MYDTWIKTGIGNKDQIRFQSSTVTTPYFPYLPVEVCFHTVAQFFWLKDVC